MRMIGKTHKPFCGNCCDPYHQGAGKKTMRVAKQISKRKEKARWQSEL